MHCSLALGVFHFAHTPYFMQLPDLVIGSISAIVGLLLIASAATDSAWLARLPKSRLLVEAVGKSAARIAIAALGLLAIVMGLLIASGWRMHWG
jgi:hypothetical protein